MNSQNLNTDPHYLNACLIDDIQYALKAPSSVLRNAEGKTLGKVMGNTLTELVRIIRQQDMLDTAS